MSGMLLGMVVLVITLLASDLYFVKRPAAPGPPVFALRDVAYANETVRPIDTVLDVAQLNRSALGVVLGAVFGAVPRLPPDRPCLCHHHLEAAAAFHGQYAAVCVLRFAADNWVPLVNPQLAHANGRAPVIRDRVYEESLAVGPGYRMRDRSVDVVSTWPVPASTERPPRVRYTVHDRAAYCLALAVDEIQSLSLSP